MLPVSIVRNVASLPPHARSLRLPSSPVLPVHSTKDPSLSRIRTAIILAAGFGTRFLPATKAVPKEMLPLYDRPVIQYIVEEARASGLDKIVIVTSGARPTEGGHASLQDGV